MVWAICSWYKSDVSPWDLARSSLDCGASPRHVCSTWHWLDRGVAVLSSCCYFCRYTGCPLAILQLYCGELSQSHCGPLLSDMGIVGTLAILPGRGKVESVPSCAIFGYGLSHA